MTGGEIAQIIVAVATLVSSIGAIFIGLHNTVKIAAVERATNGIVTKLVDSTATASKAEGKIEGRAELKAEQKAS